VGWLTAALDLFVGHLQGIAAETKIQEKKWKIL
jgi:hypothetical protein